MTPRTPITGEEVADVLERAADLIEPAGRWTQFTFARDRNDAEVRPESTEAVCWCAIGAIRSVLAGTAGYCYSEAVHALRGVIDQPFVDVFNDGEDRNQPEVVAALRSAATAARQQGEVA